jgi:hypothetical protein
MVSSSRRSGVFLLATATMMFSLVFLSATSSTAQTKSEDQGNNAKAAVGGDECVEFENGNGAAGTTSQDTDTSEPSESNSSDVTGGDAANGDSADPAASDNSTDGATPRTRTTTLAEIRGRTLLAPERRTRIRGAVTRTREPVRTEKTSRRRRTRGLAAKTVRLRRTTVSEATVLYCRKTRRLETKSAS